MMGGGGGGYSRRRYHYKCSRCGKGTDNPYCTKCGGKARRAVYKDVEKGLFFPKKEEVFDKYEYPDPKKPVEESEFLGPYYNNWKTICSNCQNEPEGEEIVGYCINCGKRRWIKISSEYFKCESCYHCFHSLYMDEKYCPCCGSRIYSKRKEIVIASGGLETYPIKICEKCGSPGEKNYCAKCGKRIITIHKKKYPPHFKEMYESDILKNISWNIFCANCGIISRFQNPNDYCIECGNKNWKERSSTFYKCQSCGNCSLSENSTFRMATYTSYKKNSYCAGCGGKMIAQNLVRELRT